MRTSRPKTGVDFPTTGQPDARARPQRTCVGCRVRVAKAELLRLVVVDGCVTPDSAGRLPGRGAHLHLDLDCLDLAVRRRAFSRAFRVQAVLDTAVLRRHLTALSAPADDPEGRSSSAATAPQADVSAQSRAGREAR